MKTTAQWWAEVSQDSQKMIDWLKDQYHGEVTAAIRIQTAIYSYDLKGGEYKIVKSIVVDEQRHAQWVKTLLESRGIEAGILEKEERYWDATLPKTFEKVTFTYFCAVAAHAEMMRLERIELLSKDERFSDIATVFSLIYQDELFHARAFREMATPDDMAEALVLHDIGMNAIGLVA